ncbi:GNAT family N-acetyltransferase [Nocardioides seonyuensis]|uniref:GNAT family N-acetyltransferase n=1 Tax=Nocardioides seonyuensis TaxID=2518371 RepID=UPI003CC61C75
MHGVAGSGGRCAHRVRQVTPTWLDGLYVLPSAQGSGAGSALLDQVKRERPDASGCGSSR